jgi:hypothetical protein
MLNVGEIINIHNSNFKWHSHKQSHENYHVNDEIDDEIDDVEYDCSSEISHQ